MNTKENKWSLEEEQQLIDLRYEGMPILKVAEIMGRTPDSVRKKHWLLMREREENPKKFWEKVRLLEESGYFEMEGEEVKMKDVSNEVRKIRAIEKLKGNSGHLIYVIVPILVGIIIYLLVR